MNFGPAEMAQMMDGARSLLTVTMVSSVGIGLVLGVIVAGFVVFFSKGTASRSSRAALDDRAIADSWFESGTSTVDPGRPPSAGVELAREHTLISNDMVVGARSDRRIFPITLSILLLIATAGGGVLFWQYVSQRSDAPQGQTLRKGRTSREGRTLREGRTSCNEQRTLKFIPCWAFRRCRKRLRQAFQFAAHLNSSAENAATNRQFLTWEELCKTRAIDERRQRQM